MGNSSSTPEQHVFSADAPVRFSQSVLDALQRSPETDSTRAKDAELKVQQRVNDELRRLRDSQAKQLEDLTSSLTTDPPKESKPSASPFAHNPNSLAYHLSSPWYHDFSKQQSPTETIRPDSGRSHDSVQMEIAELKKKLDARKQVHKVSPEVEKAQEALVHCLRTNDRRPLDCWQEVEAFKAEVCKLEKAFIQRVGR